jgi:hypothetical protein
MDDAEHYRREAIPRTGDAVVAFFLQSHSRFLYRDQFIELVREATLAFVAGCPRASIIVAGEALLRAICDTIVRSAASGLEGVLRVNGKNVAISPNVEDDRMHELLEANFSGLIQVLEKSGLFDAGVTSKLRAVCYLRNCAAHGDLPLLTEWDPQDHRSGGALAEALWSDQFEFPEGYRFLNAKSNETISFDCTEYECNTLRSLSAAERLAAIQLHLLLRSLRDLSQTRP